MPHQSPRPIPPIGAQGTASCPKFGSVLAGFLLVCLHLQSSAIVGQDSTPKANESRDGKSPDREIDAAWFQDHVQPILQNHCLECHSHAAGTMEADLALDSPAGWQQGGVSGPAIDLKKPDQSLLIRAIGHDGDLKMPPDDKLSKEKIDLILQWVRSGAPAPVSQRKKVSQSSREWWSLQPLDNGRPPSNSGETNPIDRFVRQKLAEKGLQRSPRADKLTLIRRLYYDLHGLPPSPLETAAFVNNKDPAAWEKLIDRLLSSPRYGERWARHWLDTVHFADTHGCEHDELRPHAWHYRDYVISSFNRDTPWPQFVKQQLATDYFFPDRTDLIPALGFISAGPLELSRASTAPVTFDYLDRDDIVTQTMAVFASTTANCARCHDHKFDPITQEDYYSLQAIFAGGGKGECHFDLDPAVNLRRKNLKRTLAQIKNRDQSLLQSTRAQDAVQRWERTTQKLSIWQPLNIQTFQSSHGQDLTQLKDASILVSGTPPEKDTYTLSAKPAAAKGAIQKLKKLTAIRLDVLPHASLPMQGPGRCANGNLHLNEIEITCFGPGQELPANSKKIKNKKVRVKRAYADWNQSGWTIDHAIDGNEQTAWGIFPEVGKPHFAIFVLETPIEVSDETLIRVQLKQLHGGSHLIGRFKLFATDTSVTDSNAMSIAVLPDHVTAALASKQSDRSPEQKIELAAFVLGAQIQKQLTELPQPITCYGWTRAWSHGKKLDRPMSPKKVHILTRGSIHRPGPEAIPGTLSVITELKSRFPETVDADEAARRAALAEWIVAEQNPLTWRSIVNRVWAYHFGTGISDTPNDFGRMGDAPSHPELLDWLAIWFRDEAQGSIKKLHKLILTSQTWQQSSHLDLKNLAQAKASQVDSGNRFLWKHPLRKIDAESFRDSLLQFSDSIDFKMGGPGLEQFSKSKGRQTTPELDYSQFDWNQPSARRRTIYRVVWRGIADPFLESLDFPDLGLLTAKRETSFSPIQALATLNDDFVLHFCQELGDSVSNRHPNLNDQVTAVCQLIWLRNPNPAEQKLLLQYSQQHGLAALCRILINSNEFIFIR